jgi:hypothetical protein
MKGKLVASSLPESAPNTSPEEEKKNSTQQKPKPTPTVESEEAKALKIEL